MAAGGQPAAAGSNPEGVDHGGMREDLWNMPDEVHSGRNEAALHIGEAAAAAQR